MTFRIARIDWRALSNAKDPRMVATTAPYPRTFVPADLKV